jgi:CubicO group peptidase (beta-lactamase class C family)
MQDYRPADGRKRYDPKKSIHPAYLFNMSARDRARFGWLYLNNGCWNGEQIVPADWVKTSGSPLTDRSASNEMDYGYLWWSQSGAGDYQGRLIMARGNAHQYITLFPDAGAVLVIVNEMIRPGAFNAVRARLGLAGSFEDYIAIRNEVIAARPRDD